MKKIICLLIMMSMTLSLFGCNNEIEVDEYDHKLFIKDMIAIAKDGKWGVINNKGKTLLELENKSVALDKKNGLIEYESSQELENELLENELRYIYNPKKDDIIASLYQDACFSEDNDAICIYGKYYDDDDEEVKEDRYYYIKQNGDCLFGKSFEEAEPFSDGLAVVKDEKEDKYGYINDKGKYFIKPKYVYASFFHNGAAVVRKDKKEGPYLMNKNEERLTDKKYDKIDINDADSEKSMWMVWKKDKVGMINSKGDEIVSPDSDWVYFNGYYIVIEKDNKVGLIDYNGKTVIKLKYDEVSPDKYSDIKAVRRDKKWGFVNADGEKVIKMKYDDAYSFLSSDLCPVKLNGKWGYINKSGKTIIPFKYDEASSFDKKNATVMENSKWYVINEKGDVVKTFDKKYKIVFMYSDVYLALTKGKKWVILDKNAEPICNQEFDCFKDENNNSIGCCETKGCYKITTSYATDGSYHFLCNEHDPLAQNND